MRISCGCFAVPLWVRRWLLFQQNNGERYSDTTDSRPIHHRQSYRPRCRLTYRPISTDFRPTCRPSVGRYVDLHIDRYSVDMSADIYRQKVSTDIFITHDPNSFRWFQVTFNSYMKLPWSIGHVKSLIARELREKEVQ